MLLAAVVIGVYFARFWGSGLTVFEERKKEKKFQTQARA
jgi:uncharacterized protein (DUF2062 family)